MGFSILKVFPLSGISPSVLLRRTAVFFMFFIKVKFPSLRFYLKKKEKSFPSLREGSGVGSKMIRLKKF